MSSEMLSKEEIAGLLQAHSERVTTPEQDRSIAYQSSQCLEHSLTHLGVTCFTVCHK